MKKKPLSAKARRIFETAITQPVPKRVLLDEWHVSVFISPTTVVTKKDHKLMRKLMNSFLKIQAQQIVENMNGAIDIVISQ